ncbi:MAG: hypothetical protein ACYDCA_01380 [Candidatus Tyrphobacter sp.]
MSNIVAAKLASMRKPRDWIVMPTSDDRIIVQADGAIGIFDWRSGKGRLSTKGGYFPHLAIAKAFVFPPDFVRACLQACPSLGGAHALCDGAIIVENTVRID